MAFSRRRCAELNSVMATTISRRRSARETKLYCGWGEGGSSSFFSGNEQGPLCRYVDRRTQISYQPAIQTTPIYPYISKDQYHHQQCLENPKLDYVPSEPEWRGTKTTGPDLQRNREKLEMNPHPE